MARIGMHDAKTNLSRLVERALDGEEIMLTRRGEPAVRLVPVRGSGGFASLAGVWRGRVQIADDFDELPDDIAEALGALP
jgi:prevent-host-death family protein